MKVTKRKLLDFHSGLGWFPRASVLFDSSLGVQARKTLRAPCADAKNVWLLQECTEKSATLVEEILTFFEQTVASVKKRQSEHLQSALKFSSKAEATSNKVHRY